MTQLDVIMSNALDRRGSAFWVGDVGPKLISICGLKQTLSGRPPLGEGMLPTASRGVS